MKNGFTLTTEFMASPAEIYDAWLSSAGHGAMTGRPAKIDPKVGGAFTAWDGYIVGKTLELGPSLRIVQAWRTSEFPEKAPDSRLEILLEPSKRGTRLTLIHSEMPPDQVESYRQCWDESYFQPMREYFEAGAGS